MNQCFGLDPSPALVRAETWLAVAGGARGIGYFPDQWRADVRRGDEAQPRPCVARSRPPRRGGSRVGYPAEPGQGGRPHHNGAVYVIAVNPSFTPAMARISVPGLGTCGLRVWGDGRWIVARNGVFKDYLRGLGVRIYVTPPPGFVLRGSDFSQTPPFCRRNGEVRLNGKVRLKPDPT